MRIYLAPFLLGLMRAARASIRGNAHGSLTSAHDDNNMYPGMGMHTYEKPILYCVTFFEINKHICKIIKPIALYHIKLYYTNVIS